MAPKRKFDPLKDMQNEEALLWQQTLKNACQNSTPQNLQSLRQVLNIERISPKLQERFNRKYSEDGFEYSLPGYIVKNCKSVDDAKKVVGILALFGAKLPLAAIQKAIIAKNQQARLKKEESERKTQDWFSLVINYCQNGGDSDYRLIAQDIKEDGAVVGRFQNHQERFDARFFDGRKSMTTAEVIMQYSQSPQFAERLIDLFNTNGDILYKEHILREVRRNIEVRQREQQLRQLRNGVSSANEQQGGGRLIQPTPLVQPATPRQQSQPTISAVRNVAAVTPNIQKDNSRISRIARAFRGLLNRISRKSNRVSSYVVNTDATRLSGAIQDRTIF